jgi:phage tail sheath protein FI
MPLTLTYPGVYIQELPGPPPTIAAAPTSITVFIGYTHPYKTAMPDGTSLFGQATEIFSFSDYQRYFGGFFNNHYLDNSVPYAVSQFFQNGGSNAYVVGIQASLTVKDAGGNTVPFFASWTPPALGKAPQGGPSGVLTIPMPPAAGGAPIATFYGLEPIDPTHTMTVTATNFTTSVPDSSGNNQYDMADLTISYGSVVETFRRVSVYPANPPGSKTPNVNFIETRINGNSQLVWVSLPPGATAYPFFLASGSSVPLSQTCQVTNAITPPTGAAAQIPTDIMNTSTGPFVENSSLDKVSIFNLLVIPGVFDNGVLAQAVAFCERKRAFLIMDPPPPGQYSADGTPLPTKPPTPTTPIADYAGTFPISINAALYFPWLVSTDPLDPTNTAFYLPPSGTVAGIFATTDSNRGVWKAPAGIAAVANNVTGVVPDGVLTDNQQGVLNPLGVNCLRTFPSIGTVVFGARTTTTADTAFQQWMYVPVRRMALFIEQSLYAALGWVVFEPNDTPLWTAITTSVNAFMLTLFHQGAFQGTTASEAFQVVCDATTTTQTDINNGIVNILVAFAPLKPAEFVVIQIAQLAGQSQS